MNERSDSGVTRKDSSPSRSGPASKLKENGKKRIQSSSVRPLLQTDCILNKGTDEELTCFGYDDSTGKKFIFFLLCVISAGSLLLLIHWKPELSCYLQRKKCPLYKAKVVLLKTGFGKMVVVKILTMKGAVDGDHLGFYVEPVSSISTTDLSDDRTKLSASWTSEPVTALRYFDFQHTRYIWDNNRCAFHKLEDLSVGTACFVLHEKYRGFSDHQRIARLNLHGFNIMDIQVPSYWSLFIKEVVNPFYIFQIASMILWAVDLYYYYASCIFLISCISIGISLRETRKQRVTLKNMVSTEGVRVDVMCSTQEFVEKHDRELVPGDVISIPANGCIMTCDAVLTAGTCIVNESMLTGESVPVTKTPLLQQEDGEIYSPETHKRHTLFSGTRVVQTRYYGQAKVTAVVVRTGFNTAKGELVRAILYPKPLDFQFYRDAMRFILCLAVIASLGMAYSLANYILQHEEVENTVLRVLDLITIIVPPALPAAMTVGTVYAQSRLKKCKIFCISPPRINFCGRINVFCFDKTGTLTEDGLDLWGVVPVHEQRFQQPVPDPSNLNKGPLLVCMAACHSLTIIDGQLCGDPLDLIMFNAINWYIEEPGTDTQKYDTIAPTVVKPHTNKTFQAEEEEFEYLQRELSLSMTLSGEELRAHNQRQLLEAQNHPFEVGIIRQFPFSSASQRMSVITRTMGEPHMDIYCKGAPEKIAALCKPETVPHDFHSVLHSYSIQGFRVIALAYKPMEAKVTWHQIQRISREKVERDLNFLGLLVMQNQLKPQTTPVIHTLKEADIRTVMITGDMIQTAISVARNCGMVGRDERVILVHAHAPDKDRAARIVWEEAEHPEMSPEISQETVAVRSSASKDGYETVCLTEAAPRKHLAVGGRSFHVISTYFPELMPKICVQGTIFARMAPDQKCQLIEQLQQLDYTVGMCGDGANDCEALKAAHAGISLSEAEASVAAPFTSSVSNISCVIIAMREGRAALVTSFGCFKYMALYSFIQFITVLILYTERTNLTDFQFLYIDLVVTTSIAILMGNTAAYKKLVRNTPPASLVTVANLMSIIAQVVLSLTFQLAGYFYLKQAGLPDLETCTNFSLLETAATNSSFHETDAEEEEIKTWDSTVIFLLSSFMYLAVAFTYSKGPPFRKPIYTNVALLLTLTVMFSLSTFLLLYPPEPVLEFLDMMPLESCTDIEFRLVIFGLALGFMAASCFLEWLIVDSGWMRSLYVAVDKLRRNQPDKFKMVDLEIRTTDWPPVDQMTMSTSNRIFMSDTIIDIKSQSTH